MAFEPVILKLQLLMATNLRLEAEHRDAAEGVARHRRLLDALATGDLATALDALAATAPAPISAEFRAPSGRHSSLRFVTRA